VENTQEKLGEYIVIEAKSTGSFCASKNRKNLHH
jgi:hypothetical protein